MSLRTFDSSVFLFKNWRELCFRIAYDAFSIVDLSTAYFLDSFLNNCEANIPSIVPLQRVGIDRFNLVGIAGDAERRFAVLEIKDAKARFYPVAVGTVIGLNNGKVVEIKRDVIVIEEVIKGRTGQKINRITKKLRRDEEGTQ